jgi:hypothetical protein
VTSHVRNRVDQDVFLGGVNAWNTIPGMMLVVSSTTNVVALELTAPFMCIFGKIIVLLKYPYSNWYTVSSFSIELIPKSGVLSVRSKTSNEAAKSFLNQVSRGSLRIEDTSRHEKLPT